MIQALIRSGAQIDDTLRIWQKKEEPISLLQVPYQYLSHMLLQAAARARTRAARGTKDINAALGEIDVGVTSASRKALDDEQNALLNILKAGGRLCEGRACSLQC